MDLETIDKESNVYNPILTSDSEEVHAPFADGSEQSSDLGDSIHLAGETSFHVMLNPQGERQAETTLVSRRRAGDMWTEINKNYYQFDGF